MTKGARLGKSGAKAPDRDRGREQPRRPARGRPTKRQHTTLNEAPAAAAKAVAAVKTTASQTANTPAPKDPKTAPQRRRLLQNPNPQRFCLSCERSRTAPDPPKSPAPHKPARPATPPSPIHRLPGLLPRVHRLATPRQHLIRHRQMHLAPRNIDLDHIAIFHQPDRAALGRLRRSMPDHQPRRPARETPVREQRAHLAQTLDFR